MGRSGCTVLDRGGGGERWLNSDKTNCHNVWDFVYLFICHTVSENIKIVCLVMKSDF